MGVDHYNDPHDDGYPVDQPLCDPFEMAARQFADLVMSFSKKHRLSPAIVGEILSMGMLLQDQAVAQELEGLRSFVILCRAFDDALPTQVALKLRGLVDGDGHA